MCLQELEALLASAHRPNYVVQVRGWPSKGRACK